jgi:seryl-tRNA synthetase
MLDIKWIREHPDAFDSALGRRGLDAQSGALMALDARRREAQTQAQEVQTERNRLSKEVGAAKSRGEDAADIIARVGALKDRQGELEAAQKAAEAELDSVLAGIPNLPAADVPEGPDEAANVELRVHGEPPAFEFEPKEHFELGEALGQMDFETAAKLSGARFVLLSGGLARLERALGQFMLDLHTSEFGYTEVQPPALVRDAALFGTGQLPKFADDLFGAIEIDQQKRAELIDAEVQKIASPNDSVHDTVTKAFRVLERLENEGAIYDRLWLIPTAEVPLTNIAAGQLVEENALPRRFVALTPCFRSEAGAAGKDTRGMLRQHQFDKVELVSVTHPDHSAAEHERMTACAEEVLKRLGLHFRTVVLSTGDMGFSANKTYDIEVWLPGQGAYREISSCSNCGDFQARRMDARFRPAGEKGTRFVHTLNGSGVAVGRALIAVMENYQRADGSIAVPEALRPYMGGRDVIAAGPGSGA